MKIAIIGGKLQGVEAAYLARKAGHHSILIDRREEPLARYLCDQFLCCDVTSIEQRGELIQALQGVDLVLPALENDQVLETLVQLSHDYHLNLAFDREAYALTSSKLRSDQLFHQNRIPSPRYYPDCGPPYIVKPSGASGSVGVLKVESHTELQEYLSGDWVIQEFLTGPSFSIEVIGSPSQYQTYAVTEIHMDEGYDCRKVTAPCPITSEQEKSFSKLAVQLAELISLQGIMDVEVIEHKGEFKVLEIDARIPSQTPIVVYHSSGRNLVAELAELFCGFGTTEPFTDQDGPVVRFRHFASLEHLLIEDGIISEHGEHIMGEGGPLRLRRNFFGADEVLSDYRDGIVSWRGTFLNWAESQEELDHKRSEMRILLQREYGQEHRQ